MNTIPVKARAGQKIWFWPLPSGHRASSFCQFQQGRIVSTEYNRRGQLSRIAVATFSGATGQFTGRTRWLRRPDWTGSPCGVVYRGRLRAIRDTA
jgi:hypothetical protein